MSKTKEEMQKTTIKLKDIDVKLLREAFGDESIKNIADVIPFADGFNWQEADINSIVQIKSVSWIPAGAVTETLLTYACKENYAPCIIELLLKLGANPMVSNKSANAAEDYCERYPIQLCGNKETFRIIANHLTRENWQKPLTYRNGAPGAKAINTTLFESILLSGYGTEASENLKLFTNNRLFYDKLKHQADGCPVIETLNLAYEEMEGLLSQKAVEGRNFLLHKLNLPYDLMKIISAYYGVGVRNLIGLTPNLLALPNPVLVEFGMRIKKFHEDAVAQRKSEELPKKVETLESQVKSLSEQLSEMQARNKYLEEMLQKTGALVSTQVEAPVASTGNGFMPLLQAQQLTATNTATAADGTIPTPAPVADVTPVREF